MSQNYTDVRGVDAALWPRNDDTAEPEWEDTNAMVEEMYVEDSRGTLVLTIRTDEGLLSLSVPIMAREAWNGFAESLPTWD